MLPNEMLIQEVVKDSASFGCFDGTNLFHLCFDDRSESDPDIDLCKNVIFSAFCSKCFFHETYPHSPSALEYLFIYSARVVFNEPKKAHVTPLFIRLHWLPIAARIKFKVLMFAYKTTTGTAPIYLNLLVQTYAPSRSLRSASERRLVVPSQRGTKSLSQTFSWTVPSWWNDLPISIQTADSLAIFKKHLKTHLFRQHLTN